MRQNIYRLYRCTIEDCRQAANGCISDGAREDGSFRMKYYCTMHWTQAARIKDAEFKRTHEDMGLYWKPKPEQSSFL